MSFVAAAVGTAGAVAGGIIQGNAAGKAAQGQAAAAQQANNLQRDMYTQTRADNQPYRQAGLSALTGAGGLYKRTGSHVDQAALTAKNAWIEDHMNQIRGQYQDQSPEQLRSNTERDYERYGFKEAGQATADSANVDDYAVDPELTRSFGMSDFQKDPGYDFRMQEGQKALERSRAAGGAFQGGATLKALSRYGQDYASGEYQNAYNRFANDQSNRFNRLSNLAGMGQNANASNAAAGQNYANNVGQNMMGAANAQGAAGISSANGWANTLGGLGKMGMDGVAMNNMNNWMQRSTSALGSNNVAPGTLPSTLGNLDNFGLKR